MVKSRTYYLLRSGFGMHPSSIFQIVPFCLPLISLGLCFPVELAALYEPVHGNGIEMSVQVTAQCVMLHQAVPAVFDAFASAETVGEASVTVAVKARVMKLVPAKGLA